MSRPLNFQQIQAFKAVMELGTTTRAAQFLNTTQPSVSRRIAEIQAATGLALFELHRGRLRPSDEAKLLYKTIQKHFQGLESIESVIAIMRRSGTGVLRLGSTPTLGMGLLPRIVQPFLERYPDVHIDIQTTTSRQLMDYLHQDLIDLAFTTSDFDDDEIQPQIVDRSQAVCVLPLDHPLAHKEHIHFSDLKDSRILSLSDNDELALRIAALMRDNALTQGVAIETTSSVTICALVAAGTGVGIVNPYVASTFAQQLLVKPLMPGLDTSVRMSSPSRSTPSLLARHFMELVQDPNLRMSNPSPA